MGNWPESSVYRRYGARHPYGFALAAPRASSVRRGRAAGSGCVARSRAVAETGQTSTRSVRRLFTPSRNREPSDHRLLGMCGRAALGRIRELGYQNQVFGTSQRGSVESQVPQAFTRVGIAPRFELDIIGPNYAATRAYQPHAAIPATAGVTDSGLGAKFELPPSERWTVGFDALDTPPTGSTFLTAGNAIPDRKLRRRVRAQSRNRPGHDDRRFEHRRVRSRRNARALRRYDTVVRDQHEAFGRHAVVCRVRVRFEDRSVARRARVFRCRRAAFARARARGRRRIRTLHHRRIRTPVSIRRRGRRGRNPVTIATSSKPLRFGTFGCVRATRARH